MCIAIYKPYDKKIDRETLVNCWNANPDGAGYMFAHNMKLKIRKGFFVFDKFYEAYRKDENKYKNAGFALHFRIATSGNVDYQNCHPHNVNQDIGLVHNGIFKHVKHTADNKNKSDTIIFCENLSHIGDWFYNKFQRKIIEAAFVESGSKGIFMNYKGNLWIVNKAAGSEEAGIWYSNSGHKRTTYIGYGRLHWQDEYDSWKAAGNTRKKKTTPYYPVANQTCDFCKRKIPTRYDQKNNNFICSLCDAEFEKPEQKTITVQESDKLIQYQPETNTLETLKKCEYCGCDAKSMYNPNLDLWLCSDCEFIYNTQNYS